MDYGLRKPDFHQDGDFMATIWRNETNDATSQGDTQSDTQDVPQGVLQTIVKLIYNNPNITRAAIAEYLQVSEKTIARNLKKLEKKVRFVGSGYSGHWEIIDNNES